MFNIANHKKNANQNHNEKFHISTEWPLPKEQKISAGKDTENWNSCVMQGGM